MIVGDYEAWLSAADRKLKRAHGALNQQPVSADLRHKKNNSLIEPSNCKRGAYGQTGLILISPRRGKSASARLAFGARQPSRQLRLAIQQHRN